MKQTNCNSLLYTGAIRKDFNMVKEAIQNGANVNLESGVALRHFCYNGNLQAVKYLVNIGADISISHNAPLINYSNELSNKSLQNQ